MASSFRGTLSNIFCAALAFAGAGLPAAYAAQPSRIAAISSDDRAAVAHNVSPRALNAADAGVAPASLPLSNITLRFNLTASQQASLTELLLEQQQPASANYHKWLTPEQFGAQFGLSAADLTKVEAWLTAQGFSITDVSRASTSISFSGTAGQVQHAFGTAIHTVTADGRKSLR